MKGITHLLLGLGSGVAIAAVAPPDMALRAATIAAGGIGGLLPDIDHPKAIISKYAIGIGGAVRLVASHRGPTHTVLFIAVLMGLLYLIKAPEWIMAAAAGGMVSHILADMLTVAGVPLLMPLTRRSFRLAPYLVLKATSWLLESVAIVGSVGMIGLIVWRGIRP
jgi:inner membrane protein